MKKYKCQVSCVILKYILDSLKHGWAFDADAR